LQKSSNNKSLLFKNSYLLVLAAGLVIFSFIADKYRSGNSSLAAVQQTIEKNVQGHEQDFDKLMSDTALVRQINDNSFAEPVLQQLTDKPYFIYRYFVNDIGLHQIIFWNTQTVLPTEKIITANDSSGFVKLENGYYVWRKQHTANSITIALVPVKWNYFVTNTYLENTFVGGKKFEKNYDISLIPSTAPVTSISGSNLFYLAEKSAKFVK